MSTFITNLSQAITATGTAADVILNNTIAPKGMNSNPNILYQKNYFGRVVNYHATQVAYVNLTTTATTSLYDIAIAPGKEVTFRLPKNVDKFSIIASGAGTTVIVDIGGFAQD